MSEKVKSIGPFKAIGVALNTVGTTAVVVDRTVEATGNSLVNTIESVSSVLSDGFEALDMVTKGPLAELKANQVVQEARLAVKTAKAKAKAARILAKLEA